MAEGAARQWIVLERHADGRVVRRSRRVTGMQADSLLARLRADGRDAFATRFRFPAPEETPSMLRSTRPRHPNSPKYQMPTRAMHDQP